MPLPRFIPGEGLTVPIVEESGWVSEVVWTQRVEEKSFSCTGDRTPGRPLTELAQLPMYPSVAMSSGVQIPEPTFRSPCY
jgi:hypothetical protein